MKKLALATLASGLWINLCEFLRNELLFKQRWIDKYEALGLEFPSAPINGAMWAVWGFLFAGCIVILRRKLRFSETVLLGWFMGFVLMWIAIGNMNVLPLGLLQVAVPWSLVEVGIAVVIVQSIIDKPKGEQGHPAEAPKARG